jgi:hypothetical protein
VPATPASRRRDLFLAAKTPRRTDRMRTKLWPASLWTALTVAAICPTAADEPADGGLRLAETDFEIAVPEGWKRVEKPRFRIAEYEFSVPASEGDKADGRVTMMTSGGTLDENISRWKAQFPEMEGELKEVETRTFAGQKVHLFEILGTYEAPPFQGGGTFENYRQLSAILELEGLRNGRYYVKLLGPRRTVDENEDEFMALLESLQAR